MTPVHPTSRARDERQRDRGTPIHRHTEAERGREAERQRGREAERQRGRETSIHTPTFTPHTQAWSRMYTCGLGSCVCRIIPHVESEADIISSARATSASKFARSQRPSAPSTRHDKFSSKKVSCCLTHTHTYSLAPTLTLCFEKECECASNSFLFTESAAHRKICLMECSLTRPTPGAFCLGRCSACFLCERESVCSGARSVRRGNEESGVCLHTSISNNPGQPPGEKKKSCFL